MQYYSGSWKGMPFLLYIALRPQSTMMGIKGELISMLKRVLRMGEQRRSPITLLRPLHLAIHIFSRYPFIDLVSELLSFTEPYIHLRLRLPI